MTPDNQKLISEIATKNHIPLDIDDPVFAVVTANRLMLNEAVKALFTRVGVAIAAFGASARVMEAHAGKILAGEILGSDGLIGGSRK
jgi:hypothetical protein